MGLYAAVKSLIETSLKNLTTMLSSWSKLEGEADFSADRFAVENCLFRLSFGSVISRIADEHTERFEPANRRIESHPQWLCGQKEVE